MSSAPRGARAIGSAVGLSSRSCVDTACRLVVPRGENRRQVRRKRPCRELPYPFTEYGGGIDCTRGATVRSSGRGRYAATALSKRCDWIGYLRCACRCVRYGCDGMEGRVVARRNGARLDGLRDGRKFDFLAETDHCHRSCLRSKRVTVLHIRCTKRNDPTTISGPLCVLPQ